MLGIGDRTLSGEETEGEEKRYGKKGGREKKFGKRERE